MCYNWYFIYLFISLADIFFYNVADLRETEREKYKEKINKFDSFCDV